MYASVAVAVARRASKKCMVQFFGIMMVSLLLRFTIYMVIRNLGNHPKSQTVMSTR
jgi:hypothetical protein